MIPTLEGMKIDWACSVIYGELAHREFLEKKPEHPVEMRITVGDDPLRNVDGIFNYFTVKYADPNAEFSLYFSDDEPGMSNLAALLKATGGEQNLQVEMFWNAERNRAEISKVNSIWWFDIEMIEKAAPELLGEKGEPDTSDDKD